MTDATATTDTQTSTTTATADAGATTDDANANAGATTDTSADAGAATDDGSILGSATTDAGAGSAEGGADEGAKAPEATASDNSVPDTYELKLTTAAEDGTETTVDLDPVLVETATPLLKEAGLNNEQANKLLPLVPKVQEQLLKQQSDQFAAVKADWAKQTSDDPEIGGKNLDETKRLAAKALDHFTGPADDKNEFRKLLNETGLGNHPVMVRAFRQIGASLSEDSTFVRNTTEQKTQKSREEINYPNDVPKT